jgi:WD40 repeat protein/predicted Ser/Thr protein kinase
MPPHSQNCPGCGKPVANAGLLGLCAQCLLRQMAAEREPDGSGEISHLHFGSYEVIEEIFGGGMGRVFKAKQKPINRLVALKFVSGGVLASRVSRERFRHEVEIAASLRHPNIVPIFEVGEWEGQPFFSMEFIEGPRLDQAHQRKPLTQREAALLMIQIAETVHFAHQRGILHRDIKPANILLDSQGEPRLTDFGLAKASESDATLTQTTALLGTPSYMSPEQARGENRQLTVASDVYALGAVLYELLAGCPPFRGNSSIETLHKVLQEEPKRPSLLNESVDRDLETICLKSLEKEPEKRYASAQSFADDLRRWIRGEPIAARPAGSIEKCVKWARRRPARAAMLAMLGLALIVIVAGTAVFTWRLNAKSRESNQRLIQFYLNQAAQNMTEGDNFAALPWAIQALKVDAHDSQDEDISRRRIHSILANSPYLRHAWFHDANAVAAYFAADDERVVIQSETNHAAVYDSRSGALLKYLGESGTITALAVHGDLIAIADAKGQVRIWDARKLELACPPMIHSARVNCLAFSADGKELASGGDDFSAAIWDIPSGLPRYRLKHRGRVEVAAFSPDGKLLVTGVSGGLAIVWDLTTGQSRFELKHPGTSPVLHAEFSSDGQRILTSFGPGAVVWSASSGQQIGPMVSHPNVYTYMAAFHPNGQSFATCGRDAMAKVWQTGTGFPLSAPLRHKHGVSFVTFDSTGARLASASFDNTVRIWDWARGEQLYPPLNHSSPALHASFSRDGQSILTTDSKSTRLWDISEREPAAKITADSIVRRCAFSPDGRFFAYQCEDGDLHTWDLREMRHASKNAALFPDGSGLEPARFQYPYGAAKTKDGKLEVTASKTATLLLSQPGARAIAPLPHREYTAFAAFSDDGRLLVTGSADKTARVWNAKTGVPITPPLQHSTTVMYAVFSPDLRWLMTMCDGRTLYFWSLQPETGSIAELDALSELLAAKRINRSGVLTRIDDASEMAVNWKNLENFRSDHARASAPKRSVVANYEHEAQEDEIAGQLQEAMAAYGKAIDLDPADGFACFRRALLLMKSGLMTNALSDLDAAIRIGSNEAAWWEARGRVLEALAKLAQARSDFERALALNPNYASAWNGLGRICATNDQWKEALKAFEHGRLSWMKVANPQLFTIPPRDPAATGAQLDLAPYFNVDLDHAAREGDRGNDDLSRLPRGLFRAGGVNFEIRGAIRLLARPTALYWAALPEKLYGIPIQKKCGELHFLHSTLGETAEGTIIGKYVLQYADGKSAEIPLVYGGQMRDSFRPAVNPLSDPNSKLAFALPAHASGSCESIYSTRWINRKPETEIVMLHFVSALTQSSPFLLAITTQ